MTVLVVGEALVDVVRQPGGRVERHPGGSPANVAVGLARLGTPCVLATCLGDDEDGALVREHVGGSGVRLDAHPLPRTSTAVATLDGAGAASYAFDLDWSPQPLVTDARWVHVGSVGVTQEPGAATVAALLDGLPQDVVVSYDPNCRPALMGAPDRVLGRVEHAVARARLVKLSDEDAAWLAPGVDPVDLAQEWLGRGPWAVVVTRGGAGAVVVTRAGIREVPPVAPARVVDTVGAGDAFMAALVHVLSAAGSDGAAWDAALPRALDLAARVAGVTVGRAGADPPRAADLA